MPDDPKEHDDIDAEADFFGEPFPDLRTDLTPAGLARQQAQLLLYYARAFDRGVAMGGEKGIRRARLAASVIKALYADDMPAHSRLSLLIFDTKKSHPTAPPAALARAVILAFSARWPDLAPRLNPERIAEAIEAARVDGRSKKTQGEAAVWKAIARALAEVNHSVTWQSIRTDYQRRKGAMRDAVKRLKTLDTTDAGPPKAKEGDL